MLIGKYYAISGPGSKLLHPVRRY